MNFWMRRIEINWTLFFFQPACGFSDARSKNQATCFLLNILRLEEGFYMQREIFKILRCAGL